MAMKPTNAYKRLRISYVIIYYIIYIICLLHVSPTLMSIFSEMHKKNMLQKLFEPIHKFKIMCGLKYIIKYKIQVNFLINSRVVNMIRAR